METIHWEAVHDPGQLSPFILDFLNIYIIIINN